MVRPSFHWFGLSKWVDFIAGGLVFEKPLRFELLTLLHSYTYLPHDSYALFLCELLVCLIFQMKMGLTLDMMMFLLSKLGPMKSLSVQNGYNSLGLELC